MRKLTLPLMILLLVAGTGLCATPEEFAMEYFNQIKTGGMPAMASLMHPDELAKVRSMMQPVVERALATNASPHFNHFANPDNPKKLREMTDEEFLRNFMVYLERQSPQLNGILKGSSIQVLGHVVEKDVKHVVARMKMNVQGIEVESLSVMSVKDHNGQPRMMMMGQFSGIVEAMRRQNADSPKTIP